MLSYDMGHENMAAERCFGPLPKWQVNGGSKEKNKKIRED